MEDGRVLVAKKQKRIREDEQLVEFIGEVISTESAILASSINLMRAGNIAKESSDPETLIKVAMAWYDLAKLLSGEEDEGGDEKKHHFGFAALEILDEPGDDPNKGEGGPEVCP